MCYSWGVWTVLKLRSVLTEVLIRACAGTFLVIIKCISVNFIFLLAAFADISMLLLRYNKLKLHAGGSGVRLYDGLDLKLLF